MHLHVIDPYSRLGSVVHRVPAAVKLAAAVGLVLAVVLWPAGREGGKGGGGC